MRKSCPRPRLAWHERPGLRPFGPCSLARWLLRAGSRDFVRSHSSWASHRLRPRQCPLWQGAGQVRAQTPKSRPGSSLLGWLRECVPPTSTLSSRPFGRPPAKPPCCQARAFGRWCSLGLQTLTRLLVCDARRQVQQLVVDPAAEHVVETASTSTSTPRTSAPAGSRMPAASPDVHTSAARAATEPICQHVLRAACRLV